MVMMTKLSTLRLRRLKVPAEAESVGDRTLHRLGEDPPVAPCAVSTHGEIDVEAAQLIVSAGDECTNGIGWLRLMTT